MVSAQIEYRWRFWGRWGLVGFAGSGRVWGGEEEDSTFRNSEWLPSIGAGIRLIQGSNGNHGLYIGLMEAF